jgi:surfactin synthase thioesterase subunit
MVGELILIKTQPVSTPWLFIHKPNRRATMRLFCFHYAGGGVMMFRPWPALLPAELEVCPIQLPGHDNRWPEPLLTDCRAIVNELATALAPYLDKPFAFFGHSMGGLIEFELAREFRRRGCRAPKHLFISGRIGPGVPFPRILRSDMPKDEFIAAVKQLNGTPAEVLDNPELIELVEPILRADVAVCEHYHYQEEKPLECPITVFGGLDDPEVTRDLLEPWRKATSNQFTLRMIPGDHFFINSSQKIVLYAIAKALFPGRTFRF